MRSTKAIQWRKYSLQHMQKLCQNNLIPVCKKKEKKKGKNRKEKKEKKRKLTQTLYPSLKKLTIISRWIADLNV